MRHTKREAEPQAVFLCAACGAKRWGRQRRQEKWR